MEKKMKWKLAEASGYIGVYGLLLLLTILHDLVIT